MRDLWQVSLNALLVAGLYATMSYGLALIYGVMKIINLAHAGFIMLGAYLSYTLFTAFGVDPFLSVLVTLPLFFGLGVVLYRVAVERLPQGGDTPAIQSLLLLFGVWLVLQNAAYFIWSGDTRSIMTGYTLKSLDVLGVQVGVPHALVFLTGVLALLVLQWVLSHTYLGKAIRAVTQNRQAALLVGVSASRIAAVAFGIGTAFAGLAGNLMSTLYAFSPDFGRNFLLKAFCIIVLGGMDSFVGVALGALVVALVEAWASLAIPAIFQDAVTFSLLVVALVALPGGVPALLRKGWSR